MLLVSNVNWIFLYLLGEDIMVTAGEATIINKPDTYTALFQ
jgi:hypothetical protein